MSLLNLRYCGARTKQHEDHRPCKQPAMRNKQRCRIHGGKSTGPRTLEGKMKSADANFKNGMYTKEAIAEKKMLKEMLTWRDDISIF